MEPSKFLKKIIGSNAHQRVARAALLIGIAVVFISLCLDNTGLFNRLG